MKSFYNNKMENSLRKINNKKHRQYFVTRIYQTIKNSLNPQLEKKKKNLIFYLSYIFYIFYISPYKDIFHDGNASLMGGTHRNDGSRISPFFKSGFWISVNLLYGLRFWRKQRFPDFHRNFERFLKNSFVFMRFLVLKTQTVHKNCIFLCAYHVI